MSTSDEFAAAGPDPAVFPFTFACQRSGNCCAVPGGVVRVSAGEIAGIALHLGLTIAAVRRRFVAAPGDRLLDGAGTRCVFLQDGAHGATCSVYPARPAQCRSWPFWPELLASPQALASAMRRCPGITPRPPASDVRD